MIAGSSMTVRPSSASIQTEMGFRSKCRSMQHARLTAADRVSNPLEVNASPPSFSIHRRKKAIFKLTQLVALAESVPKPLGVVGSVELSAEADPTREDAHGAHIARSDILTIQPSMNLR